jgi:L-fucose mutarotase/ribose pyranase (RbsD/FucU family)
VRSGERRFYGNILLAKGVVDAAGRAPRLPGA